MQRQEIFDLIKKYNAGTASEYEKEVIESWYAQFERTDAPNLSDEERALDLTDIWQQLPVHGNKVRRVKLWYRVSAAAAVLLFISVGVYFLKNNSERKQQLLIHQIAAQTSPGGNKAILVLNDGKQVVLTGANNGTLIDQGDAYVTKTAEGKLAYQINPAAKFKKPDYNTMLTPAGGTYELTLGDGTKVTLDASSSIRYPVSFAGKERRVEITGQAYFEVAHDPRKPFRVTVNGETIEVLGTHFNINAYTDQGEAKTTLLQGSVKVSKAGNSAILKPGQQSVYKANSGIAVSNADIETAIAWKNGYFKFKHADLQTVIHQFARWYNIEVAYEGEIPKVAITGKVLRSENAERMLQILTGLGIRFKMEGKKIIILEQ